MEKTSIEWEFISLFSDGSVVLTKDSVPLPIPTVGVMGMRVTKNGLNYKINLELIGLTMYWDGDHMLTIEATAGLFNRTAGLCGTLDQSIENDFMSKDGKLHKVRFEEGFSFLPRNNFVLLFFAFLVGFDIRRFVATANIERNYRRMLT